MSVQKERSHEAQMRCRECGWEGGAGDAYALHTRLTGHLLVEVTEAVRVIKSMDFKGTDAAGNPMFVVTDAEWREQ